MTEVAKRRHKGNRQGAKHPWPDSEVDESRFASVTADIVVRAGARPSKLPSLLADSQKDDHKGRFLGSTAGLLVYKGEAEPSVIEMAREAKSRAETNAVRREADEEIRQLRNELAALKGTLADRDAALAEATFAYGKSAEREISVEDAEQDRRQQSARMLAEMSDRAETAEAQIRQLNDELASIRSTLADRETALAQATADRGQSDATDAQIRSLNDELASIRSTLADREAALAQAAADREQSDATDAQIRSLNDELASLRSTLADRDDALALAALDHAESRARWEHESQAALSGAERAWKAAEAARLSEAEAKWQQDADKALTASRTDAQATRESVDAKLRALEEQVTAMQATIRERESALSRSEQAREQSQQELEAALTKAKTWQTEESQRLAAAEAQWKAQSAKALAEAQARYQAAEGALVQLRLEADRARSHATGGSMSAGNALGSSKSADRSVFGTKAQPPARESKPEPVASPAPEKRARGTQEHKIVLQPGGLSVEREYEPSAPRKRRVGRDVVVAAVLAIVAIVAYPRLEPLIPEPWRSNIAAVTARFGLSSNIVAQGFAVVIRDVNLRSGPSTSAEIIATLPRGLKLMTLARREEWTLVQIAGDEPRQGWVFSSFLETAAGEDDVETTQPEDSE